MGLGSKVGYSMDTFSHVPPGFRFHPTDEELVDYYLRKKVSCRRIDLDVIRDVDLYRIEPWDLQELCRIGTEEQDEWYFFSHKDKKYPTGTRTNRATAAGFWKATGRDKAIYSKHDLIGMRKTLVFYKGRAPNGQKSDWIMHEYRLETDENATPQEEGWVVCRVFKKRMTVVQKAVSEHDSLAWFDDQVSFMPDLDSPKPMTSQSNFTYHHSFNCKKEIDLQCEVPNNQHSIHLPILESPKPLLQTALTVNCNPVAATAYGLDINHGSTFGSSSLAADQIQRPHDDQILHSIYTNEHAIDQVMDWRALDKFVASQLSQEVAPENHNASISNSTCQIDPWK